MLKPATLIPHPQRIPTGFRHLGRFSGRNRFDQPQWETFFAHEGLLIILSESLSPWELDPATNQPQVLFSQVEFPLDAAIWFVETVAPFHREGVLVGSVFGFDAVLDGEKINLWRGPSVGGDDIPGWTLTNYSRREHEGPKFPQEFDMPDPYLFQQGMFAIWQDIARRHQAGEF